MKEIKHLLTWFVAVILVISYVVLGTPTNYAQFKCGVSNVVTTVTSLGQCSADWVEYQLAVDGGMCVERCF